MNAQEINSHARNVAKEVRKAGLDSLSADGMVTDMIEEIAEDAETFDAIADRVWELLGGA